MTSPDPTTTPSRARFIATELLWWIAWFALSFLIGWDVSDQLTSPLFWLVAAGFIIHAIVRWRRLARQGDRTLAFGADVAQLVEQLTRNEQVVRSSRIVGSIYLLPV